MTRRLLAPGGMGKLEPWSMGAAQYEVDYQPSRHAAPLPVAVRCRLATLPSEEMALLDTGATWSIIGGEAVDDVIGETSDIGQPLTMSTRRGSVEGRLHRMTITLVADEGEDLVVDGTALLAREWDGPIVLGYQGFLQRIRVALDPGIASDQGRWLYFGGVS